MMLMDLFCYIYIMTSVRVELVIGWTMTEHISHTITSQSFQQVDLLLPSGAINLVPFYVIPIDQSQCGFGSGSEPCKDKCVTVCLVISPPFLPSQSPHHHHPILPNARLSAG